MTEKPHQNLAIIGHVDHGKSTLVGRLLFETGSVPEHVIEQHREEAEEKGKGGFEFAYVMDNLAEERERGVPSTSPTRSSTPTSTTSPSSIPPATATS